MRLYAVGACIISSLAAAQEIAPARLTIRSQAAEAVITIDGDLKGFAPRTETLPPGVHTIVAEAAGVPTITQTVSLTSGESRVIDLSFVQVQSKRAFPVAGTVMLVSGAALMTTGLLLRFPAEEAGREVSRLFANGGGWDANAQRIENDGVAAETWSWVLVGLGVATVASSVIVGLVERFGGPHDGPKLALMPLRDGAFVSGAFTW